MYIPLGDRTLAFNCFKVSVFFFLFYFLSSVLFSFVCFIFFFLFYFLFSILFCFYFSISFFSILSLFSFPYHRAV